MSLVYYSKFRVTFGAVIRHTAPINHGKTPHQISIYLLILAVELENKNFLQKFISIENGELLSCDALMGLI